LAGATILEYTLDEVLLILRTDFQTLETILGHEKPFLFGMTPTIVSLQKKENNTFYQILGRFYSIWAS
jgi:hypothetical protein